MGLGVKLIKYDGKAAVDYAKDHWNKVCHDGRVLSSAGATPACGQAGIPDGTEFFFEASKGHGAVSPTDFLLVPAAGHTFQTKTETFSLKKKVFDYNFSEPFVRSIDEVTADISGTTYTFRKLEYKPPSWAGEGELIKMDEEFNARSRIRWAHVTNDDGLEAKYTGVTLPWGNTFKVTYTYCKKAKYRVSWAAMNDCSHFISCCLIAGGLPVWPNDHPRVGGVSRPCCLGQHGVNGLYKMLKQYDKDGQVKLVRDKVLWNDGSKTEEEARDEWNQLFKDEMSPGDVILYYKDGFQHSAIYVDTQTTSLDPDEYPRITCHTVCRYPTDECTWDPARWNLGAGAGWGYTLAHIL